MYEIKQLEAVWEQVQKRVMADTNLCESLRSSLKGQDEAVSLILERAQREKEGYHILPGTEGKPFFVGKPPCWHEDRVGDDEYVVCLNRMGHWNDFIAAYALQGDKEYPQLVITELLDWIRNCPCPKLEGSRNEICDYFRKPIPWRTLEVGIRMLDYWPNAFTFLIQEGFMDRELFVTFAGSVVEHAKILVAVPPHLWPNADHNHYIMENLGLFYAGMMLQELPEASEWIGHAQKELERCVKAQLTADGGQIEGCPSYHNVCMYLFCRWALAAEKCEVMIPHEYLQIIRNALDYSICSLRPTGVGVPWGDSDPNDQAIQVAIMGYQVFGNLRWLRAIGKLISTDILAKRCASYCFVLDGLDPVKLLNDCCDQENRREETSEQECELPLVCMQRKLQQAMFRTGWDKEALSVFFACRIPVENGHAHIDPAAFDFCALGKALLVDPGRFCYREDEDRRYFKSAKLHNTLTIGEKDPFAYVSTYSFTGERDGCMLFCREDERFMAAACLQTSYFPAIHERLIAIIDNTFLLVWDRISHLQKDLVEIWYHMDSENVRIREDHCVCTGDEVNLCIRSTENLTPRLEPGLISEALDVTKPSTRLCLFEDRSTVADNGENKASYASVLCPYTEEIPEISAIIFEDGQEKITFTVNGKSYSCSWRGDRFGVD